MGLFDSITGAPSAAIDFAVEDGSLLLPGGLELARRVAPGTRVSVNFGTNGQVAVDRAFVWNPITGRSHGQVTLVGTRDGRWVSIWDASGMPARWIQANTAPESTSAGVLNVRTGRVPGGIVAGDCVVQSYPPAGE